MKYKFFSLLIILVITNFLVAGTVFAQSGESTVVNDESSEDEIGYYSKRDNFYISGDEIEVNNEIEGDIVGAGNKIVINKDVDDNLYLSGGEVIINGKIGESVIIAAGAVEINGDVRGDLFIVAGVVVINGNIYGDVRIGAGEIHVNSKYIRGDFMVGSSKVVVADRTRILGEESVLGGNMEKGQENNIISIDDERLMFKSGFDSSPLLGAITGASTIVSFVMKIVSFIGFILLGYFVIKMFPVFTEDTLKKMRGSIVLSVITGIIVYVIFPIIAIILAITVVGWNLLGVLILLGLLAMTFANIFADYLIGRMLLQKMKKDKTGRALPLILGMIVVEVPLMIIGLIPFIGGLLTFFVKIFLTSWGVGAIVLNKRRHK